VTVSVVDEPEESVVVMVTKVPGAVVVVVYVEPDESVAVMTTGIYPIEELTTVEVAASVSVLV
jgi:hypothetical protein